MGSRGIVSVTPDRLVEASGGGAKVFAWASCFSRFDVRMMPMRSRFCPLLLAAATAPFFGCGTPDPAAGAKAGVGGVLYYDTGSDGEIWKLDLASGHDAKLGFGKAPTRTKEGTLIFVTNDLVESAQDLTTLRIIVKDDPDIEESNNGFHDPQLSPDGTRVAYSTNDHNVYVAQRNDGAIVARFEDKKTGSDGFYRPTWTPDGRLVVGGGFGNQGLFISDAGLKTLTRLDKGLAQPNLPAVSPDGTKVIFVLNDQIYVVGIDGANMKKFTDDVDTHSYPAWSPDGSRLAYTSAGHLDFLPVDGGDPSNIFDLYPEFKDHHLIFSVSNQFDWK